MMMECRKWKGRLGSGALGPNNDPNPEVPLKIVNGIKHTAVPTFINILHDKVTGVGTAKSIVMEMELGSGPPPRPRSMPSSTPWPGSPDSVSESKRQAWGRDTRSEEKGTGSTTSTATWCSTSLTEGRGSSSGHTRSREDLANHPHSFGHHPLEPAELMKPREDPHHL